MDTSRRAAGYDLFKLIVAIILLILLFILMRMAGPQSSTSASVLLPATGTLPSTPSVVGQSLTASPTRTSTSRTPVSPTATNASGPTSTPLPSPTATTIVASTDTPPPSLTETPIVERTSAPIAGTSAQTVCEEAISRSRLQVGMKATLLRRLNFRSSPGLRDNWLLTNIPGTQVEVIGGSECVPYATGAYVWWPIRVPDGREGWSAEGSVHGTFYFMEPSP